MVVVAAAGQTSSSHVDFFGSVCAGQAAQLVRKEKQVLIDYTYSLNSYTDSWKQWFRFPDLHLTLYMTLPQMVTVTYIINVDANRGGRSWIINRVKVDGKEDVRFRAMSTTT